MPAPKPVYIPPPQLDLSEEVITRPVQNEEEREEKTLTVEKLSGSLSKFLGFIASIGLPPELMRVKIIEYSQIAEETGVCEALIETIEYYFPDTEISPVIFLAVAGIAFAVAVITDRLEIKKQLDKKSESKTNKINKINKENKDGR